MPNRFHIIDPRKLDALTLLKEQRDLLLRALADNKAQTEVLNAHTAKQRAQWFQGAELRK